MSRVTAGHPKYNPLCAALIYAPVIAEREPLVLPSAGAVTEIILRSRHGPLDPKDVKYSKNSISSKMPQRRRFASTAAADNNLSISDITLR